MGLPITQREPTIIKGFLPGQDNTPTRIKRNVQVSIMLKCIQALGENKCKMVQKSAKVNRVEGKADDLWE